VKIVDDVLTRSRIDERAMDKRPGPTTAGREYAIWSGSFLSRFFGGRKFTTKKKNEKTAGGDEYRPTVFRA